jgi:hypothetical protein
MTTKYIPVTISDFEKHFGCPSKKNPAERAFFLNQPRGEEAFYACKLKDSVVGELWIKVYTSIKSGNSVARNVGEDAIRVCVVWQDATGWSCSVGEKPARVYRAGGSGSTANDVVLRAFNRAREVALEAVKVAPCCPRCSRPMSLRNGSNGSFWGCIGFGAKRADCRGTLPYNK